MLRQGCNPRNNNKTQLPDTQTHNVKQLSMNIEKEREKRDSEEQKD